MHFHRELIATYLLVLGGLAAGVLVGVLLTDTSPAFLGWVFAGGAGLSFGAFIAALTSGVQLAGSQPDQERFIPTSENGHTPAAGMNEEPASSEVADPPSERSG